MFEAVALAFLVAKIRRIKLMPLIKCWAFWPVLFFSAVYVIFEILIFTGNYQILKYASLNRTLGLLSFLVPVIRFKLYKHAIWGAGFVTAGSVLNSLAMAANGGKMPVFPTLSRLTGYAGLEAFKKAVPYDNIHVLGNSGSRLILLTDIFDVGFGILSLGDILVRAYAFIITYAAARYAERKA